MLISLESIYRSYVAVALILSGWLKTAKLEGESPPVIGTDLPWWGRVGAGQLVDLGKINKLVTCGGTDSSLNPLGPRIV